MSAEPEISPATARNWERLGTDPKSRLTSRANKKRSEKRMIPAEYLLRRESADLLQDLLSTAEKNHLTPESTVYTLCVNFLRQKGVLQMPHVKRAMGEYDGHSYMGELRSFVIPENEFDFIGAAYQSMLCEGKKNILGSYYTPEKIAAELACGAFSRNDKTDFLDPCCGSGAFLLASEAEDPRRLYGCDTDPIAVMIAKTNLLCKYPHLEFTPNIRCGDYLGGDIFPDMSFGFIAANPPWGAVSEHKETHGAEYFGETFSRFFAKAYSALEENGRISFLFPEAILNVKAHRDIREFILNNCRLERITLYNPCFSGVATGFAGICAVKASPDGNLIYRHNGEELEICPTAFRETKNFIFLPLSPRDTGIINKVRAAGKYDLSSSSWALGIVTGDNKGKLLSEQREGTEPVYTGREIFPYKLSPPVHYIHYERASLQQAARDEFYRAPEKLVYRFISDKLVFALDDTGSLFLNSANILIPKIPNMSAKTVMAFLDSPLYSFLYKKLFGEIKILRGNLSELPFPHITPQLDRELSALALEVIRCGSGAEKINGIIYNIFGLTDDEIIYIEEITHCE